MNLHEVIHEYLRLYKLSSLDAEKFLTDVISERKLIPHIQACVRNKKSLLKKTWPTGINWRKEG